jgi:hypothetical protein
MGDDHGWDETGYNGHPHLKTPVLDEMAACRLRLDRFYSAPSVLLAHARQRDHRPASQPLRHVRPWLVDPARGNHHRAAFSARRATPAATSANGIWAP